eukprot:m.103822 g.103822  ORF g.103822 m.103822 type:complete len:185 (+) comp12593_c0_seq1:662-1216(+)
MPGEAVAIMACRGIQNNTLFGRGGVDVNNYGQESNDRSPTHNHRNQEFLLVCLLVLHCGLVVIPVVVVVDLGVHSAGQQPTHQPDCCSYRDSLAHHPVPLRLGVCALCNPNVGMILPYIRYDRQNSRSSNLSAVDSIRTNLVGHFDAKSSDSTRGYIRSLDSCSRTCRNFKPFPIFSTFMSWTS